MKTLSFVSVLLLCCLNCLAQESEVKLKLENKIKKLEVYEMQSIWMEAVDRHGEVER